MNCTYNDFPTTDIKNRVWVTYPKKGTVIVDGFRTFKLKELKQIPLNTRLSFPPKLFTAIDKY